MTSEELAQEVEDFIERCQDRITGTGNEQYSRGDRQLFEDVPLERLIVMIQEEIQDVACYATMLEIRLERLRSRTFEVDNQPPLC